MSQLNSSFDGTQASEVVSKTKLFRSNTVAVKPDGSNWKSRIPIRVGIATAPKYKVRN
jgi:hypothetical protein